MASSSNLALFLCLNLVLSVLTSADGDRCGCGKCGACTPTAPNPPATEARCPVDTLKLGACANLLGHLLKVKVGEPPVTPCCSLIKDLADVEAALCLCTVVRASLLGIRLDLPVSLSLLLNTCGKNAPPGFECPN